MPQQLKEVDITAHHRPTEWVKAGWWAFLACTSVLIVCFMFIQRPHSLMDAWSDVMTDFVIVIVVICFVGTAVGIVFFLYKSHKTEIVDVSQYGTVVKVGKKTIELAPIMSDSPQQTSVSLVTPSEKAGKFLPYMEIVSYLQGKGVDLKELEDCVDEQLNPPDPTQEFTEPQLGDGLTELQKRVLGSWERGHRGRLSIHKNLPDVSEHIAARTISELKGKGVIQ